MRRNIPLAVKFGVSFILVILLAVTLVYTRAQAPYSPKPKPMPLWRPRLSEPIELLRSRRSINGPLPVDQKKLDD